MDVEDVVDLGDGHSIEFGRATWNTEAQSVRNRYETRSGGFSPHSSSEFPVEDVEPIAIETARRDLLSPNSAAVIIQALAESIVRQTEEQ